MYKFEPILKTLVWGTEKWVLSGLEGCESVVSEGPAAGKKISEIYKECQFPLLIKLIDAKRDLSIQVHPDDALAWERHKSKGKSEMWYIINAAPGAKLISGLSEHIDSEDYVRLVREDKITSVLASHDVHSGDVFFLPAGRIHAIGGGCYLAEIQETSDITYRIYDYNRPGLDGKPRQLHTELAKDAIDYRVSEDYRTHYSPRKDEEVNLVNCRQFVTDLLDISKPLRRSLDDCGNFLVVIALEGEASLETAQGRVTVNAGECVLVEASEQSVLISPTGESAKLLTTFVPV